MDTAVASANRHAQGQSVGAICRGLGVSEQSYYRWPLEYGGMEVSQAQRLKELERENARLKKVVCSAYPCVQNRQVHIEADDNVIREAMKAAVVTGN